MTKENRIQKIYDKLLVLHGPQGWWPVVKGKQPLPTYHPNNYLYPKTKKQQFEIIIGAILTQNTSWKNVEKAIKNLNDFNLIDIRKISRLRHEKLASLITPSGYFNQKAKTLRLVAKHIEKRTIEKMFAQSIPKLRKELLCLHGIGKETADSIILYSAKKPIFVIDTYTKRIFSHLGLCKENDSYEKVQKLFIKSLKNDYKLFNEYHALIVQHAKKFYFKKELYAKCPLLKKLKKK